MDSLMAVRWPSVLHIGAELQIYLVKGYKKLKIVVP